MSHTDVDIYNIALGRIGITNTVISSTENSKEARLFQRFFALCRDEVLERVPWPFAVRTIALAQLSNDDDLLPGWAYQYAQPSDALQIMEVVPAGEVTDAVGYYTNCACDAPWMPCRACRYSFRRASSADGLTPIILSQLDDAYAVYTSRLTSSLNYSAMYVSTLAWRIAMEIAMPLTQDARYVQMATTAYNAMFMDTASRQFEQEAQGPKGDAPAVRARW
jgi:hypothetical protein